MCVACVASVACSTGCAGGAAQSQSTAARSVAPTEPATVSSEPPKAPRKPDGVLLDPAPALPNAADRASARGVVSLREPLSFEAIKEIARAYVRSYEHEEEATFSQLLTSDATPLFGGRAGRQPLLEQFRSRIKNYDYAKLGGSEVARLDQIERYELSEVGVPGSPERPPEMKPGDLLIRLPIATPRIGSEPLFGDVVILLLRRDEGRFKIAGVAEENGP